jgi:hypothetical protein
MQDTSAQSAELSPVDATDRVILKDDSGNAFGVDLRKAQRFEITRRYGDCSVIYRIDRDLWVREFTTSRGRKKHHVARQELIVEEFLGQGLAPPDDLTPELVYSLRLRVLFPDGFFGPPEDEDYPYWLNYLDARLIRLRNGLWVLLNMSRIPMMGGPTTRALSREEAVDLLIREKQTPPDDLWEILERRRPSTREPAGAEAARHVELPGGPDTAAVPARSTPPPAAGPKPEAEGAKPRPRRGRKPDTDPKADQRVADAWETGSYTTYADCAKALGMTRRQVERALDRHRKRTQGKQSRREPASE